MKPESMDHSSLTEAQQQQQYQEHQQAEQAQQHQQQLHLYQQYQNQDYSSQPYDSSHFQAYASQGYDQSAQAYNQSAQMYNQSAQAYNQSAEAYYPYYQYQQPQQSQHPQQYPQQQQQQQQYQYYQPDYGNVYQQPAHQQQPQQESGSVQPPGVPVSHEAPPRQSVEGGGAGSGHGQVHVQHQQNSYYPQGGGEQQSTGFPLPPGLNAAAAAAVAALSQLTQFAGTMDAAERAMAGLQTRQWHGKSGDYRSMMGPGHGPGAFHGHGPMHHGRGPMRPPAGRPPYRGGGRRGGGGPYRGGGRGNFGPRHPFRGGGSGSLFRGRGRGRDRGQGQGQGQGRGGSRRFAPYSASSSYPESAAVEDTELPEGKGEPSGALPEEAGEDVVAAETSPSTVAPGDSASNWQSSQAAWCELCRVDCTSLEILEQHKNGKRHKKNMQRIEELKNADLTGTEMTNEFHPEIAHEGEEESEDEGGEDQVKELPSEAIANENSMEGEQKSDIEQPETPTEERSDSQAGKPGMEHFDNNWRHGMKRRMRGGRGGKRMKMFEAPRRPSEPPKPKVVIPLICDLCNVKCDTQEVFDRHLSGKKHIAKLKRFEGHQALYGPMGLQALYPPNPIAQTLLQPQGHQQQGFYGPPGSFTPQGPYMPPPQVHQAALTSAGAIPQFQQNALQGSEAHPVSGGQAAVSVVHESQQQSAVVESGSGKESVTEDMNHVNGISESGGNLPNPTHDNGVTRMEQDYAAAHEAAPPQESGVTVVHVEGPEAGTQLKEGAAE